MTQPTKNEQSIRTILHFLDKYIIQNSPAFTLDMYKERGILSLKDDIASGIKGIWANLSVLTKLATVS